MDSAWPSSFGQALPILSKVMSTAATTQTRKQLPRLGLTPEKGNEILGVLLCAVVVLLTGSLVSYNPLDPSVFHRVADTSAPTHNLVGPFGAQIAALGFAFLGLAIFFLPCSLGVMAWRRLTKRKPPEGAARILGLVALFPTLPAMLQLVMGEIPWRGSTLSAGGGLGTVVADLLSSWFHPGGAFIVLMTVTLVGGCLAMQSTLGELFFALRRQILKWGDQGRLRWAQRRKRQREQATKRRVIRHHLENETETPSPAYDGRARAAAKKAAAKPPNGGSPAVAEKVIRGPGSGSIAAPPAASDAAASSGGETVQPEVSLDRLRVTKKEGEGQFAVRRVRAANDSSRPDTGPASGRRAAEGNVVSELRPAALRRQVEPQPDPEPPQQETLAFDPDELVSSELPPVNLLCTDATKKAHDETELVRLGEVIRQGLEHFGIAGSIERINPGPVITTYEFQPAPGIKVSRIVNLQDDLALALKAESVRIDRMPGRSTLGIEVPNEDRSIIHLGRMLDDDTFRQSKSVLTMAIGVDMHGRPYYTDLATMPHLLVAGATGAGKSVGLQSMITSILYGATRDEVQFIFIDPKRIELGVYADIPHLKTAVVMEPKKAANALRWAVSEMERRYRLLAELHVRSINYYNRAISDPKERQRLSLKEGESEFKADDFKPLPYYVIIIDELADLMMVSSSDVEASIARLAQMARAVGIHLIVATQRPSVDVLTGTIKANFPCRLAFATATRHDSRTILDQVGAEKLLGKGDALFVAPGTSRVRRLHGAYISEQETAALIRWLKRRGKPQLDLDILKTPESEDTGGKGGSGGGDGDELFDEAARLVVSERMGSASFLQRRLRVGFSRAARLIDMLEADGLLGPAQGSKPREVLVDVDYFGEIDRVRAGEE